MRERVHNNGGRQASWRAGCPPGRHARPATFHGTATKLNETNRGLGEACMLKEHVGVQLWHMGGLACTPAGV